MPVTEDGSLKMVDTGHYGYISDQATLRYISVVQCEKYSLTDITFNIDGLAFAISKNNPYLEAINQM